MSLLETPKETVDGGKKVPGRRGGEGLGSMGVVMSTIQFYVLGKPDKTMQNGEKSTVGENSKESCQ